MVIAILGTIAGKLIGFAATEALKEFSGNSIDMRTIRIELGAIVKEQLIENTIMEQEGHINAVIKFLKNTYQNEIDNGAKKEDLYKILTETYEENFLSINDACTTLLEKDYKIKGISTYIAGQEVLFAYLQEEAKQDPTVMHYTKSKHIAELVRYAYDAITNVSDVADLLYKERCSKVSELSTVGCYVEGYEFSDDYTFKKFSTLLCNSIHFSNIEQLKPSNHLLLKHKEFTLNELKPDIERQRSDYVYLLKNEFSWIYNVIEQWRTMVTTPPFPDHNPDLKNIIRGPNFSDQAGWDLPQYYKTIQFADIDGDGKAEMIGRSSFGLFARKYEPSTGLWGWLPDIPELSDNAVWNYPEYYETIQCADIDSDGQAELIARSDSGILAWKFDLSAWKWEKLPNGPALSDQDGWGLPQYYETIQCADIDGDGRAELIARSSFGIEAWKFEPSTGKWDKLPDGPKLSAKSNWNKPEYYETIQCADIDGDGRAELIARSTFGLHAWKYEPSTKQWVELPGILELSDKNGWNKPEYYKTIQCADIDGDRKAEIIARSARGIVAWKYEPSTLKWEVLPWGPDYSDQAGWGLPQYYETIQCADIDGDGRAELIARSSSCIVAWKYEPSTLKWDMVSLAPKLSDNSALANWNRPQYYETIQCADIDGDLRAELIGRDGVGIFAYKF